MVVFLFRCQKGSKVYEDNLEQFASLWQICIIGLSFHLRENMDLIRDTEVIQKSFKNQGSFQQILSSMAKNVFFEIVCQVLFFKNI